MADSNSTKLALAHALRTLARSSSLEKISVTDICRECEVNRKSFYYHFSDKYALVNWIFDTEFSEIVMSTPDGDRQNTLLRMLEYLYENRAFYRRALRVKGQNSFSEHFRELLVNSAKKELCGMFNIENLDFRINFYADAFVCTIERWLLGRDNVSPAKLCGQIKSCLSDHSDILRTQTQN